MFEGLFGNIDEDSGNATSTTASSANFAPNAKVMLEKHHFLDKLYPKIPFLYD